MDDLERRAGKGPEDQPRVGEGGPDHPHSSDYADPRAAQPGEDPPGEDAMQRDEPPPT
jgi:hypothetical protein